MATIRICDRCGERPPYGWYGLDLYEMNADGRAKSYSTKLDLCTECYWELLAEFDYVKKNTPSVDVKVVG